MFGTVCCNKIVPYKSRQILLTINQTKRTPAQHSHHISFACCLRFQKNIDSTTTSSTHVDSSNDFPFHLNHRASFANKNLFFAKKNMFYSNAILAKKGPLGKIWLAAHFKKKLNKKIIYATNIRQVVGTLRSMAIFIFLAPFTYIASPPIVFFFCHVFRIDCRSGRTHVPPPLQPFVIGHRPCV